MRADTAELVEVGGWSHPESRKKIPDFLAMAVSRAEAAAAKWQALSQKTFINGMSFALDAAAASARVACANLLPVAASAPVGNLDVYTLTAPDLAADSEKKIALADVAAKQRVAYAAWAAVAALAAEAVLYGSHLAGARNIAAKAFNRLPCRDTERTGKNTVGARERALHHRRWSRGAHALSPKPAFGATMVGYLMEETEVHAPSEPRSYSSYKFTEYSSKDKQKPSYATPIMGTQYAFLRRWSPINLRFETIIILNENGTGLHYVMSGYAEYVVAAGEVTFDIRYLGDGTPIFSVQEVKLRSSRYLPGPEIRFCTGFPEYVCRTFQDDTTTAAAAAGGAAADAAAGAGQQYPAEYPQPEAPSSSSSSKSCHGLQGGMLIGRGRRHSHSSSSEEARPQVGDHLARMVQRHVRSDPFADLALDTSTSSSGSSDASPRSGL